MKDPSSARPKKIRKTICRQLFARASLDLGPCAKLLRCRLDSIATFDRIFMAGRALEIEAPARHEGRVLPSPFGPLPFFFNKAACSFRCNAAISARLFSKSFFSFLISLSGGISGR
jgi:hypothetical protein